MDGCSKCTVNELCLICHKIRFVKWAVEIGFGNDNIWAVVYYTVLARW